MSTILENVTTTTELPATVTWIGRSGDWYDAANWSTGKVPTNNDIVTIENKTRGTTYEISFSNGKPQYSGLNLLASNSGVLKLSGLTDYQGSNQSDIKIEAKGNGSLIDLSDVTSLKGGSSRNVLNLNALQGGAIDLGELTKIDGGTTEVLADGTGSTIDLSKLTEFIDDDFNRSLLKTRNRGSINLNKVTKLDDVDLSSDNSVLYLENLTTYVGDNNVDVIKGGQISLIKLNSVTGEVLQLTAAGAKSRIVISQQLDENEYIAQEASDGDVIVSNSSTSLNYPPFVKTSIPSQKTDEGVAFSFTIPVNTFVDLDPSDSLTYTATIGDSSPLPSWLIFNPTTRTFSGTPHNQQVGKLNITVRATDGQATAATRFSLEVVNTNDTPTVTAPIPDLFVSENEQFSYTLAANTFTDIDTGDVLTYSATLEDGSALPSWLSFDPATRTYSGTPPISGGAGSGNTTIKITVSDRKGAKISENHDIKTVENIIPTQTARENQQFTFRIPPDSFSDFGNKPIYSASGAGGGSLPSWLTFNPATATFRGTPKNTDLGELFVTLRVSDGQGKVAIDTFSIVVKEPNIPPIVASPIPEQGTIVDRPFSYAIPSNTFTDTRGDTLTYSVTLANGTPLPRWLTFNPTTQTFTGTPSVADYGVVNVSVKATDPSNTSATSNFALNVDIDAAQYGASYRELIDTYGYDLVALSQHYRQYGRNEGRNPDLFDENRYVASNTDLIAVPTIVEPTTRLVNADGAAEHYVKYGFGEMRSLTRFQPDRYIASHKDLINSIGYNLTAGSVHYIQYGLVEGRAADTFDEYRYLAGNDDLLNVYKTDVVGATKHYIEYGAKPPENRDPLLFKPDIYLASNGYLISAFKPITQENYASKLEAASQHYVLYGRGEGRVKDSFNPAAYLANNSDITANPLYANDPTRHYLEYGYFEGRTV